MMMPSSTVRLQLHDIVDRIEDLPTLPSVVMKMLDLVSNTESSIEELSQLISTDQVLMMKVLKMANSSFYGFPREISTVDLAIVALGFNQLKCLGLSLSVMDRFSELSSREGFNITRFWEHSVGCGLASRMLAKTFSYRFGAEAFVAGLLHDIGKVLLCQYCPREFNEVIRLVNEGGLSYLSAEQAVMDVTHTEIGHWLAGTWNLPAELVDSIAFHHQPDAAQKHPEIVAVVHLSDILCRMFNIGHGGDGTIPKVDPGAMAILKTRNPQIGNQDLNDYETQLMGELEKADTFLSLIKQPSTNGREVA